MIRVPCPSDSWDAYEAAQEGPEGLCANCLTGLPEEDPDPENSGTSPWWDGFCSEHCRQGNPVPSDEEMLAKLDAYGHITWTVGYDREDGDWLACFDAKAWKHPSRGWLIAYHVVVNSDSGGFIMGTESGVVPASEAPRDLPERWFDIGCEGCGVWLRKDSDEAEECNARWNTYLEDITQEATS